MFLPFRKRVQMNLRLYHLIVALMMTVSFLTIGNVIALERKNFSIPEQLTTELKVKVTYNNDEVLFRFEWPSGPKGYFHDYLHFKAGKWVKTPGSSPGSHLSLAGGIPLRLGFRVGKGTGGSPNAYTGADQTWRVRAHSDAGYLDEGKSSSLYRLGHGEA